MVQKYQVFINDHLISIIEKVESNQQFQSELYFKRPDGEEIVTLVNGLLKDSEPMSIVLLSDSAKSLWELFQNQFKIIKAAGGLVKNQKEEILFIKRLGKWDLPKGKIEEGESPKEAALREVEEECGISNLKLKVKLPSTFHIYENKEKLILKETYWFNMDYSGNEELIPQKEEGVEEVIWIDSKNIEEQRANTYASLKSMIEAIV